MSPFPVVFHHYPTTNKTMDHAIRIDVCVDNAAFGVTYQEQADELARILRDTAERITANPSYLDPTSGPMLCIKDINGNRVGHLTID